MNHAQTQEFIERWYPNYHLSDTAASCRTLESRRADSHAELKLKVARCRLFFHAMKNYLEHMEAAMSSGAQYGCRGVD